MADLTAAQRAFEASARVFTAIDQMLEVLMNTGVVGR
jgi:flagellar hook-associated protein FlgK